MKQIRKRQLVRRQTARCAAVAMALAAMLALFPGCAGTPKRPTVEPLPDGRPGFVIREPSPMKDATRADFGRAVALLDSGRTAEAIVLLKKVIAQEPGFSTPHIDLAMAYLRTGTQDLAEQHLRTALELVPGHPAASNEYGLLLRSRGRFAEAREVFQKAISRFPDYLPVRRNLGILCDLYLNDPGCALEQFELYGSRMPADEQIRTWIAELRIRLGKN